MIRWLLYAALFAVGVLIGLWLTVGCSYSPGGLYGNAPASHSASHSEPEGNAEATTASHCGVERWPVKTGTDAQAAQVNVSSPTQTTIANLTSIPAPATLPQSDRVDPIETTAYTLSATLVQYKIEDDQDVHMVITDGPAHMIAELPSPSCVDPSSPWHDLIATARAQFNSQFHPTTSWQHPANVSITITGPGFFDFLHGQTGVAPNGIEIHPVLMYHTSRTGSGE